MDKATLERVFDPFFTTKPPGQGTGLGLSVVHGIMKAHAGAVTVDSEPGKCTTFRLYFPAMHERQELPEKGPAQQPVARGRGERVLYLDDEEALILLTSRVLRRLGYEVTGYSSPAKALEAFRLQPEYFDAVITDIAMPGMSGFEFARNILEIRAVVPIVIVSGYVRTEDQERAAQMGIRELILKPNTVDELARTLDRVLHQTSQHG
jgi:CheY-like chemotaxis protein